MTEGFAAVGLHRPSRPENIGGVFRAADVYGVRLVVLGGGEPPASRRLRVCRRARDDVEIRACRTPRPPRGVMSTGHVDVAKPWPNVETYEHWHEADRRALERMQPIVAKIDADPSLIQIGVENMKRWRREQGGYQPRCLDQWEEWFESGEPWERIRERHLEASDEGQRLRTSHPFASVLTQEERESVYDFNWDELKAEYETRTGRPWPASREMVLEQFGPPPR